jgi:predicted lipoprotein with Yx(FWY)xxD motif
MKSNQLLAGLLMAAACTVVSAQTPAKISDGALVAANGMTLYTFDADKASPGKSVCNGPCAALWPPLMAGTEPATGNYNVITRDDGTRQLAYKGKPLYFYKADQKAGDRTGDNFKDVWHIVKE